MNIQSLVNSTLCFLLVTGAIAASSAEASVAQNDDLEKIMKAYKGAETIILDVKKTVKSEVLDKESSYWGIIRFAKGKIHWVNEEPEKSMMIYDGEVLWTIQYPPKEFNSPPQIAKTNLKKSKNTPLVLNSVFGSKPLKNYFEIVPDKTNGTISSFILKAKKDSLNVKELLLTVDTKLEKILILTYKDEVDNSTKLEFKSTRFNEKIRATTFSFKPPKDSVVTEY
jgi:outer membrane lipoprotein-sorting protein